MNSPLPSPCSMSGGTARFERRPTIVPSLEIVVGRRDEAPLVPPYSVCSLKMDGAVMNGPAAVDLSKRRS